MKKVFTLIFVLFAITAFAQQKVEDTYSSVVKPDEAILNPKSDLAEIIIGVPKVNEKNLFILTSTIEQTKGMQFVIFCPVHSLLLLKYDKSIFAKNDDILTAFKQKHINMPMFIKEGKFDDVKDLCNN